MSSNYIYEMRKECKLLFSMVTLYLSFFVRLQLYIINYCFIKETKHSNEILLRKQQTKY